MGELNLPKPTEQARQVREYWDIHLEENPLRIGVQTGAGAFLSWMIEAAGDIVRELGKNAPYYDCGYISEKVLRIHRNMHDPDWRRPLSEKEWQSLGEIKRKLDNFPTPDETAIRAKNLLQAITNRNYWDIKETLGQMEDYLGCGKIIPEKAVYQTPGDNGDLARAIREDISAEMGAINQYTSQAEITEDPLVKEILNDIADEEKVHAGEFLKLLNHVTGGREWFHLEKGVEEVRDKIDGKTREPGNCRVVPSKDCGRQGE